MQLYFNTEGQLYVEHLTMGLNSINYFLFINEILASRRSFVNYACALYYI